MDEFEQMAVVCERLFRDAAPKLLFLTDKNGAMTHSIGSKADEIALGESCAAATEGTALSDTEHLLPARL